MENEVTTTVDAQEVVRAVDVLRQDAVMERMGSAFRLLHVLSGQEHGLEHFPVHAIDAILVHVALIRIKERNPVHGNSPERGQPVFARDIVSEILVLSFQNFFHLADDIVRGVVGVVATHVRVRAIHGRTEVGLDRGFPPSADEIALRDFRERPRVVLEFRVRRGVDVTDRGV